MKILFSSYVFSPSVGGIETVSALLAPEFVRAGHEVVVVTNTEHDDGIVRGYPVYRKPDPAKLIELTRWCDVYFQSNISLRFAWPLLFIRRPWIIAHQTWLHGTNSLFDWQGRLKLFLLRFSTNVAISDALAQSLPPPVTIIGNPYFDTIFKRIENIPRKRDLAFLGRLVSEKGVDLLIQALKDLRLRGSDFRLSVIGSGPEEPFLRALARRLGVEDLIDFLGTKSGDELARILGEHRVLVVPSRVIEPFGVVALEGMASGCYIIGSDAGGLPNVIGRFGVTFKKDDASDLASKIATVLAEPETLGKAMAGVEKHLAPFQPETVAASYLEVFNHVVRNNARRLLIYSTLPLVGGNSTITLNVAREFRQEGWQVSVLTRHQDILGLSEENIAFLREMGCEVRKLTRDDGKYGWPTISALMWIARRGRNQIFLTLCKGFVSPVVSTLGRFRKSVFYLITHEEKNDVLQHLASVKRFYSEFAVISPISAEPLREMIGPEKPIRWLPQFSDMETAKVDMRGTQAKRNLAIGYLGTLNTGKGVDLLLKMWPRLKGRADLRIAGGGPLQPEVEAATGKSGVAGSIYYEGAFNAANRDDFLRKFFASIDYLIVPSVNTMEGIPTVILEALSFGIPAIASDLGGTACFGLDWLKPRHPGVVQLFPLNQMEETVESFIAKGFPSAEYRQACIDYYQEWFSNRAILERWTDVINPSTAVG
jgi:glycosyltransferase involved in cell wall biosynthesis